MQLPLEGIRVVEMSHMIMGPSCGMFLAQFGADVVKVEPPGGDKTRELRGMGTSFFPLFNRGKRSLALDLGTEAGREALDRLLATADVFIENFRDGMLERIGCDPQSLRRRHPRLIVCGHKGFLSGPYQHRPALDEVVQMMAGLAYMTGPSGRPLRVGSSANDIMAGLMGAFAIVTALLKRTETGGGRAIRVGLFENCVLLVAQHMIQYEITGERPKPMPERDFSWPVYDIFETADGEKVFVTVVTDGHWQRFCREFGLAEFLADPELQTQMGRINARPRVVPHVAEVLRTWRTADLLARLEALGLPFAEIKTPVDLYDDPHVKRPGGLLASINQDGRVFHAPSLPLEIDGTPVTGPADVPPLGADSAAILSELGYEPDQIATLTGGAARAG